MREETSETAEMIGIILGDGCVSKAGGNEIAISGDLQEEREYYDEHVIPLFNKTIAGPLLGRKTCGKAYPSVGVYGIYEFDEKLFRYVEGQIDKKGKHAKIPSWIIRSKDREVWANVLKGLFDTDGTVFFDKIKGVNRRPKIKFSTVSREMLEQVIELGNRLGFHFYRNAPFKGKRDKNFNYAIELQRKGEIERWFKEIGFENSKHKVKYLFWKSFGFHIPRITTDERKELLCFPAKLKTIRALSVDAS